MLVALVTIFVCCWLPINVFHLINEYFPSVSHWQYHVLLFFAVHIIAMMSAIYNPFLYALMSKQYRMEFRKVLPCLYHSTQQVDMAESGTKYTNANTDVWVWVWKSVWDKGLAFKECSGKLKILRPFHLTYLGRSVQVNNFLVNFGP